MNFESWLISKGTCDNDAKRLSSSIAGVISRFASQAGLVHQSLYEITRLEDYRPVAQAIRQQPVFDARNTVSKGAYEVALQAYGDYLQSLNTKH